MTDRAGGRITTDIVDPRLGDELWYLVRQCDERGITQEDLRLAGEFIGAGYLAYRNDLDVKWLAGRGSLLGTVAKAREWQHAGKPSVNGSPNGKPDQGLSHEQLTERIRRLRAKEAG